MIDSLLYKYIFLAGIAKKQRSEVTDNDYNGIPQNYVKTGQNQQ